MVKERVLMFEVLCVMDVIDCWGSFVVVVDELGWVFFVLSYIMQKLEEELDVVLFDCFGYCIKFINVGCMLLECGWVLLEVVDKLMMDVEVLVCGWEIYLMLVIEVLVLMFVFFLLIDWLVVKVNMQFLLIIEVLVGVWEWFEQGWVDIVIVLDMYF